MLSTQHSLHLAPHCPFSAGKSLILKGGVSKQSLSVPNTLNCLTPKLLWVSWRDSHIIVGEGALGRNIFLDWLDSEEDDFTGQVGQVEVLTAANVVGDWVFSRLAGTHTGGRERARDSERHKQRGKERWERD
jgi:hypothetical protein